MPEHFEDIAVGKSDRFGQHEVTREAGIAFARQFDPQPFHLDDQAAAATFFGKLSASGWHTAAMTMAMLVEKQHSEDFQNAGSSGVDQLRFPKPVYPGDVLTCGRTIPDARPSSSRPDLGIYREEISAFNQHGDMVLGWQATAFALVRGD